MQGAQDQSLVWKIRLQIAWGVTKKLKKKKKARTPEGRLFEGLRGDYSYCCLLFSHSVVSNSLRPVDTAGLPVLRSLPELCSDSCRLSR